MPFTQDQIAEIFTYHAPDSDQQAAYQKLRDAAAAFAAVLIDQTPPSADQSAALRMLRECVMTANAAIALRGKY